MPTAYAGWTALNESEAIAVGHPGFSELDRRALQVLASGFQGKGVIEGCNISAQTSPNMTVKALKGHVLNDPLRTRVPAATSATITADATNPRYVLIEVDGFGALVVNAGAAAAAPVFPAPTSGNVVLAAVAVNAGATSITNADILDLRVIIADTPQTSAAYLYLNANFD